MTDTGVKVLDPLAIRRDCEEAMQATRPDSTLHERLVDHAQLLIPQVEALREGAPDERRRLLDLLARRGREVLAADPVEWLRTPVEHLYDLAAFVRSMTTLYQQPPAASARPGGDEPPAQVHDGPAPVARPGRRLASRVDPSREKDGSHMKSKAQEAAQATETVADGTDVASLVDPSAVVRSEDVEQEECYTF